MLDSYLYFIGTAYLLVVWFVFFFLKKNRTEMLYMSAVGAALGPVGQIFYLRDWWSPQFIYSFPLHIEDILFGFAIVGICSVCYETLFKKTERSLPHPARRTAVFISRVTVVAGFSLFALTAQYLGFHSFTASLLGTVLMIGIILWKRRDFLFPMAAAGFILMLISIPFYTLPLSLNPEWIEIAWKNEHLSGQRLIGIPIEEFVWYFFIGAGLSVLWELAHSSRFVRMRA